MEQGDVRDREHIGEEDKGDRDTHNDIEEGKSAEEHRLQVEGLVNPNKYDQASSDSQV